MPVDDLQERGHRARVQLVTDEAIALLAPGIGTRAACAASGVPQATWYRRHRISPAPPKAAPVPHIERLQPRALAVAERQAILDALHSERFADLAPDEIWATLLDEGTYLGSVSTYYRVLREPAKAGSGARRPPTPPPSSPSCMAAGPNQVWSWDITKLHGPAKWTYYHLYVILDIFSRYVAPQISVQILPAEYYSADAWRPGPASHGAPGGPATAAASASKHPGRTTIRRTCRSRGDTCRSEPDALAPTAHRDPRPVPGPGRAYREGAVGSPDHDWRRSADNGCSDNASGRWRRPADNAHHQRRHATTGTGARVPRHR